MNRAHLESFFIDITPILDFRERFADTVGPKGPTFSNVREGLIVGLLSIGAFLHGSLQEQRTVV